MSRNNIENGMRHFKDNSTEFFREVESIGSYLSTFISKKRAPNNFSGVSNLLGVFHKNFAALENKSTLIKREGDSEHLIEGSSFFFNHRRSGYKYFEDSDPRGREFISGLSLNIADLLEAILDLKGYRDSSNDISEEGREEPIDRVWHISNKIEYGVAKAGTNLLGIFKILWPNINFEREEPDKTIEPHKRLFSKEVLKENSTLLDMIKKLDLQDIELEKQQREIDEIKTIASTRSSEYFSKEYQYVCNTLEAEILWFPRLRKILWPRFLNYLKENKAAPEEKKDESKENNDVTSSSQTTDKRLGKLSMIPQWLISLLDLFHSLFLDLFTLRSKIFLLRTITYAIPIFLVVFHFCEFFGQRIDAPPLANKECKPCLWFYSKSKKDNSADILTITTPDISIILSKKSDKPSPIRKDNASNSKTADNDSYRYFHFILISIFAVVFHQLRIAIKDLSIKKSLYEIYRHRVLVSKNFLKMYIMTDVEAQNEVIKSATRSLFENEPSIYESGSKTLPPNVVDIKNLIGK